MPTDPIGTLLAVEDEPEIRKLTCMYAESIGFEVLEAEDGQAALDLLKQRSVDVIVSDMKMPRKDGLELLKELREMGDRTPFLFLSAFTSKEYTVRALSLGAFDYLEKPFMPNELKALLNEMSRVSRAQRGALTSAGLMPSHGKPQSSPEAEILRIGSLHSDTSPSVVDLAASGGVDRNVRLKKMFTSEAQNQLTHGLRALTDLRHAEAPGWQLGYLFRLMHSIRTSATSLQLKNISELAHAMEQAYVLLRVRTSFLNKMTLASLNVAHEVLRRHLDTVGEEANLEPSELARLTEDTQRVLQELKSFLNKG